MAEKIYFEKEVGYILAGFLFLVLFICSMFLDYGEPPVVLILFTSLLSTVIFLRSGLIFRKRKIVGKLYEAKEGEEEHKKHQIKEQWIEVKE